MTVRLEDCDIGTSSVIDSATVNVKSFPPGVQSGALDEEMLSLVETGSNTGVFTGQIRTAIRTQGTCDGVITVTRGGDVLSIAYSDSNPSGYQTTSSSVANARGLLDVEPRILNNYVNITVVDGDLDRTANLADSSSSSVVACGDLEISDNTNCPAGDCACRFVAISETGLNTGVFTAQAPLAFGVVTGSGWNVTR